MKKVFSLLSLTIILMINDSSAQSIKYPKTKKSFQEDTYFGTAVKDPYRSLENDTSKETAEWVSAQNKVTQDYLAKIPFRNKIKERLTKIWNYERFGVLSHHGNNYFYYKNDGLQNQSSLFITNAPENPGELFFDPNKLSKDGTVALGTTAFNKEGTYFAYAINRSGSDWQEIYVVNVKSKKRTKDSLNWVKFSGISWKGNGFYYSRFDEPKGKSALSAENSNQKVYFHKLGTPQSKDELIFEDKTRPLVGFSATVSEDQNFLFIYATEGASSGNELYYKDLRKKAPIKQLFKGFEYEYEVVDNIGNQFLIQTTNGAPKKKLVLIDPSVPISLDKVIIPEKTEVIAGISLIENGLIITYMKDAAHKSFQYDLQGTLVREVQLPSIGTVSGFEGKRKDKDLYYSFTSFTFPNSIFKYNIQTGKSEIFKQPNVSFNPMDYETKQVFVPSKWDGTPVPIFIVYKKGTVLNGKNPTYLYAYGGFDVSLNPSFSASRLILLENGGVFALANLRGGGEYGQEWHKAGMLLKKQNVFDDFISCAEYLIANKYTSREKLAIAGGSNGGLLVGACMTQRPDLFKVCFPAVGVMDMLRFHKFTIGHAWVPEYGSSEKSEADFKNLLAYSPIHNIRNTNYPATMVTTADHDDRVVPAHSFKFAATLQENQTGNAPTLIRIDAKAGHGAGKPTAKVIEEQTDIWSFFFYNMGENLKY